jgi:uncharacterized protein (TIGR00251 family)
LSAPPVALPSWLGQRRDEWLISLRIQPGARAEGVVGLYDDALKIRVRAPALDGRANAALLRYLSERLGVPLGALTLVRGAMSRDKAVALSQGALGAREIIAALCSPLTREGSRSRS